MIEIWSAVYRQVYKHVAVNHMATCTCNVAHVTFINMSLTDIILSVQPPACDGLHRIVLAVLERFSL